MLGCSANTETLLFCHRVVRVFFEFFGILSLCRVCVIGRSGCERDCFFCFYCFFFCCCYCICYFCNCVDLSDIVFSDTALSDCSLAFFAVRIRRCLLYTSPSPRDS